MELIGQLGGTQECYWSIFICLEGLTKQENKIRKPRVLGQESNPGIFKYEAGYILIGSFFLHLCNNAFSTAFDIVQQWRER
jgi:hypothetical protein